MVAANLASKLKLIETSQRLVDAKSRLDTNHGEQKKLTEQIAAAEAERSAFTEEWRRKLAEEMAQARSDKGGVEARLTKAQLRQRAGRADRRRAMRPSSKSRIARRARSSARPSR